MDHINVPFCVVEGIQTRLERVNTRLFALCIILIVMLVGTNAAWLYYENQWQTTETMITQDLDAGNGGNAIINDGVHVDGKGKADSQNENP